MRARVYVCVSNVFLQLRVCSFFPSNLQVAGVRPLLHSLCMRLEPTEPAYLELRMPLNPFFHSSGGGCATPPAQLVHAT